MSDFDLAALLEHTRVISTTYPRRFMGEPEEEQAARHVAAGLERAGADVALYRVPVLGWELDARPLLDLAGPEGAVSVPCAPSFYSGSTPTGGITGRLVRLGDNFAGSGPVYEGERPSVWTKYGVFDETDRLNPLGLVLARPQGPVIAQNGVPAGSTVHRNGPVYVWPACSIGQADGDRLAAWMDAGERVDARYAAATRLKIGCTTTIVCGEIRGTRYPDEVIVVGAHHDTMGAVGMPDEVNSPGACDNASAVGILLEVARLCRLQRPQRTLWLCSFGGEERHLVGSSAFVRMLNEAGALGRVVAYLGVDQAAYGDVLRLLSSAGEAHLAPAIDLRRILAGAAADLRLQERFKTFGPAPVHAASDHWPFFYAGVPAFLTGWHPFDGWHRHTDTFDRCTEDDQFLAAADLLWSVLLHVGALPRIGPIRRSPAAGFVLTPPTAI